MEALPTLRCVVRRSVICFLIILMTFFACAFYTFFSEPKNSSVQSFKIIDIDDVEEEIRSSLTEASELRDAKLILITESPSSVLQVFHPVFKSNVSIQPKIKNANSVQADTRYIYLNKSTSVTSTSTSTTIRPCTDTCSLTMKDSKLILLWTPFFEYWNYLPKEHFSQCSRCKNCEVTTDRSKLLESDAVIFHARDMSITDMPPFRLRHQRWIFYCLESPPYSDFPGLLYTSNMFNWTMTYRADSDIPSPYGYVTKIRPPRKLDMEDLEWAWTNKSRSVVWMSSHCPTHGGRDLFAEELRKYIDIDVYGKCGTQVCPNGQTEQCLLKFAQQYKFFLAFENTLCKDYITEKFFRTLKYNIIPVVFGGADYDIFAPPGSFIDALSFKSPKHLAFFLTGVGKNFKLYSSYFKWRKNYAVTLGNKKECQLCSMLHNKINKSSSYKNLRDWWVKGSRCKTWKPPR